MKEKLPGNNSNLEQFLPFADVDLIITDIDGTLICGAEPILMQIKKTIKSLKKQNVELTVATGRTFYGTNRLLKELEIKERMPIVLFNGSVVLEYGTENVLYSNFIDWMDAFEILKKIPLDKTNVYFYTFEITSDAFRREDEMPIIENVYGTGPGGGDYDVNGLKIAWVNEVKLSQLSINAILIEKNGLSEEEKRHILSYLENNKEKISFTDSGNGYIELKASGLAKGIIYKILKMQKKYKINKILAIGDNDNDKELFQLADISVAVANASSLAIEEADYICEKESAAGFLDMLEVIKTAKKYYR